LAEAVLEVPAVKKLGMAILVLLTPATAAPAAVTARIGDVTRLKGQGINYLTGMGLVLSLIHISEPTRPY